MSAPMTKDEMRAALQRQGIAGDAAIERALALHFPPAKTGRDEVTAAYMQVIGEPLVFPIRLTLPWSTLVSDNNRKRPMLVMGSDRRPKPRMTLTPEYRAAAEKIRKIARAVMTVGGQTFQPLAMPLCLTARVYVPSGRRCDVSNFSKGVQDALSRIVYADDLWLEDCRWMKAGVDTDAPRADVEIAPR